ncbi:hypothetical protein [Bartonella raoultii]|uniref:hypothetical protein n=1 Tax=Bartonella raoultii TaxID=1457020 RepID=UPI001ABB52A2|nr:hypothetical protein [Bartonella raoultii]
MSTATDLFGLWVEGRVSFLQLREGVLYSDRFGLHIDFETNSIVQNLRTGRLVPRLFFIFQQFFIVKNSFCRGAYQVLYQKILLKILKMDVQDEQRLAENILSTVITALGYNIVQKTYGMKPKKTIKAYCAFLLRTGYRLLV